MSEQSAKEKTLLTPEFTLCFPKIEKPEIKEDGSERYSICMLFDEGEDISEIVKLLKEVKVEVFGEKFKGKLNNPIKNGDTDIDTSRFPNFEGKQYINCSTMYMPAIVDGKKVPINPSEIYPGCKCKAIINSYGYNTPTNKGLAVGLQAIQKVADGEKLGGGAKDFTTMFEVVESSETVDLEI